MEGVSLGDGTELRAKTSPDGKECLVFRRKADGVEEYVGVARNASPPASPGAEVVGSGSGGDLAEDVQHWVDELKSRGALATPMMAQVTVHSHASIYIYIYIYIHIYIKYHVRVKG